MSFFLIIHYFRGQIKAPNSCICPKQDLLLTLLARRCIIYLSPKKQKGKTPMGKFVIKALKSGCKFILKAANGKTVAMSEIYNTEKACINGINSVKKNCSAPVDDKTSECVTEVKNPKYELYKDKNSKFRFRLKSQNGRIIAVSDSYNSRSAAEKGIESIKNNAENAEIIME